MPRLACLWLALNNDNGFLCFVSVVLAVSPLSRSFCFSVFALLFQVLVQPFQTLKKINVIQKHNDH